MYLGFSLVFSMDEFILGDVLFQNLKRNLDFMVL